jgi:hypothetical protein
MVVAGFAAWLIFGGDNDQTKAPGRAPGEAVSASKLQTLPAQVGHDFYWAGKQAGFTYEFTQTNNGNTFLRYLPAGVALNDPRPNFLTVGTYPRPGAYATLKKFSAKQGSVSRKLGGGGIAVYGQDRPSSIYVAYPGVDLEVEVYDPSPSRALRLVLSGRVQPVH